MSARTAVLRVFSSGRRLVGIAAAVAGISAGLTMLAGNQVVSYARRSAVASRLSHSADGPAVGPAEPSPFALVLPGLEVAVVLALVVAFVVLSTRAHRARLAA